MGGIWTHRSDMLRFMHECVGFRVGLAVSEDRLTRDLRQIVAPLQLPADERLQRFRSEEVERSARLLLRHYGDPAAADLYPVLEFVRGLLDQPEKLSVLEDVLDATPASLLGAGFASDTPWEELKRDAQSRYGALGVQVLEELREAAQLDTHLSPWGSQRWVEWRDVLDLAELSNSESVSAMHGTFFDQRFIGYLARDVARIDTMNWRKFEALIAERFVRLGLRVELGPGRGDDGVDIRVWGADDASALTIIQCKRQQSDVSQVIVKALASDVGWTGADHGLLVTSTRAAPSAKRVIETRSYPVRVVERDAIAQWLAEMSQPSTGLWMPD